MSGNHSGVVLAPTSTGFTGNWIGVAGSLDGHPAFDSQRAADRQPCCACLGIVLERECRNPVGGGQHQFGVGRHPGPIDRVVPAMRERHPLVGEDVYRQSKPKISQPAVLGKNGGIMIIWKQRGDLLDAQTDALVNAVNTRGVMGRGLAEQFRRRFPDHYRQYRSACAAGEVKLGRMLVTRADSTPGLTIVHFPTKDHWRSSSRLADIESGLAALRATVAELELQSIAVPALGCGLGGLAWEDVRPLIERSLQDVPARVLVYLPQVPDQSPV